MTGTPRIEVPKLTLVHLTSICGRRVRDARLRSMNRWRKLLVLLLLCVTMPLQAMAALRTHCAPGTSATSMQTAAATSSGDASGMMAMHHAMMMDDSEAMPGMHHHGDDGRLATNAADNSANNSASAATSSQGVHNHHASCSACAACVVCTALPPSVVLRLPDAQPSTAIPFLHTTATSAIVAVLERPPKARIV